MKDLNTSLAGAGIAVAMSCLLVSPAGAGKWPGTQASPGAALAAKAIGQACKGVLAPSQIAELDAYLAKAAAEAKTDPAMRGFSFDRFVRELSADYAARYRDAKECNADATEEARDSLKRVRAAMASGRALPTRINDRIPAPPKSK